MKRDFSPAGPIKKWLAVLIIFALCALPAISLADSEYLAVKGGRLNLRESGSLAAKILGQYPTGTWVMVLDEDYTWAKVLVGGKTGYMMNSYLTAGTEDAVATRYVRTNTGAGVNLRQSPDDGGTILTGVAEGTKVDVLVSGIGWYKVKVNDTKGYIASQYLATSSAGSSTNAIVNNPKSTQRLNLREAPSLTAAVLGRYKNPTPVTILQSGSTWCKVQVDGITGYMMTTYLKMTNSPYDATIKNPNGGSYANFRSGPSWSASIIDRLPVGTGVEILDKGTDWTLVSVDGETGYVSTWFLVY